jgi:hypothetical protein
MRFLTELWAEEVAGRLAADDEVGDAAEGQRAVLDLVVPDAPDGAVRLSLAVCDRRVDLRYCDAATGADAVVTYGYRTAVRIAAGELTPADAFGLGLAAVSGDLDRVVRLEELFDEFTRVVAGVPCEY